jgi:hypothetical protein
MSESINLSQIIFDDDADKPPPNEAIVQSLVERIRKGEPLKMPALVKWPNGRHSVVLGWYRVAAAERCGVEITAAVVKDVPLAKLQELRRMARESSPQEDW